jgi:hypothetical protein
MKKFAGLMALAIALSFGTVTVASVYAGDPAPAPTDQDKKQPSGPKAFENEKKDEKKDDKGGK